MSATFVIRYITDADMSYKLTEITVATNNQGKLAELKSLLGVSTLTLRTLADFPHVTEVDETGATFQENARLKAAGYALQTGTAAMADDSGLVIDALDGRPGVLSARYGGEGTGFPEKMESILTEMAEIGGTNRRARFVCAIAIAAENGEIIFETEGVCEGHIADAPRGSGGFGYDPIFVLTGFEETFGELSAAIKGQISHRARAFCQIIPFLRDNTVN